MPQKPLFGANIHPACEYCAHSHPSEDPSTLHCAQHGAVAAYHACENFLYAPLRRIPRRAPNLPSFSLEDFKL